MNEDNCRITLPCDVNPSDSLKVEYVNHDFGDESRDYLSIDLFLDDMYKETLIFNPEIVIKLRDFLIEKFV